MTGLYSISKTSFIFTLLILVFPASRIQAQDVGGFFKEIKDRIKNDPVKINGGISTGSNFSQTTGIPNRYDPFNWNLNAYLNFDIVGIKAPFSFNYSNGNSIYNLPAYHFYGISPSYKWITLHFGDRSLNFSPYSLAGHNFFGAGIELSPGKFRFIAMHGRLKRATASDLNNVADIDPSYRRTGWGFKTGYVNDRDEIYVTFFSADDDPESLSPVQIITVKAKENVVLELNGKKHLGKQLFFSFDIARSSFTRDVKAPGLDSGSKFFKNYGGLIESKISTGFYHAVKGSIGFKVTEKTNLQLNYERIDPGYRTLGSLFFNDDMENFTLSTSTAFFKDKINLTGSMGLQRDNLSGFESNTNNRLIGNINATYVPGEQFVFNASYSNFRNTSKVRFSAEPFNPVDSISLALVNQNASLAVSYTPGKKKNTLINTMISYQTASSILNEEVLENQNSDFITGTINYTYTFPDSKLILSTGLVGNYTLLPDLKTFFFTPTLSVSKNFLKNQLKASSGIAYSSVYINQKFANRIFNFRLQTSYHFSKKHHASLMLGMTQRNTARTTTPTSFFEFMGNVRYGYRFSL